MLGKEGRVFFVVNLFNGLIENGFLFDVYLYILLIFVFVNSGRYRDVVMVFKKMEEEGCKLILIIYNVVLNVFGKMGIFWSKIMFFVEKMKSDGIVFDVYMYNMFIICCK